MGGVTWGLGTQLKCQGYSYLQKCKHLIPLCASAKTITQKKDWVIWLHCSMGQPITSPHIKFTPANCLSGWPCHNDYNNSFHHNQGTPHHSIKGDRPLCIWCALNVNSSTFPLEWRWLQGYLLFFCCWLLGNLQVRLIDPNNSMLII